MSNAPSQQFSLNLVFIPDGQTDRRAGTHEKEDREREKREWMQATRVGVMIPASSPVIAFSWAVT